MKENISSAVRNTEEQWWEVIQAAEAAVKQAEEEAASERNFEAFKAQTESVQTWIREQRQKLLDLGSHAEFEQRLQTAQVRAPSLFTVYHKRSCCTKRFLTFSILVFRLLGA